MKRILPVLFSLIFLVLSFISPVTVNAQQQLDTLQPGQVPAGDWRIDPEVTFIGKNAARSGNLLDFTLENYNWVCIAKDSNGQCDNSNNPLTGVWLTTVTYIVVPLLFIVIISAAVVIIITRGRSITIMRFLPRFVGVLLLIFLSFALLQFFYQFIDVIQGFFLRKSTEFTGGTSCPPECISQEDLLFVGWDYQNFIGLRRAGGEGDQFAESAFISLLLTKLTALTYYVMVGILVLRKIILWLFIIVSPVFPILLLFYPIRNTGKIWIGEFFRWLLYAPLFAIFLKGLVVLWREGIPLVFNTISRTDTSQIVYPTAVNILLGGPKEFVTPTNSINLTESFALYVFSLLMLWGVIILPWILLQIFLDYASSLAVSESPVMKSLINKVNNLKPPPASPSPAPAGGGTTINLPFTKKFNLPIPPSTPTGLARSIPTSVSEKKTAEIQYMPSAQIKAQTMSIVDMSLPTIRDIAKYDSSLISNDKDKQRETIQIREKLEKIANPALSTTSSERERFTEIRSKLEKESTSGNTLATSILNAASMTTKQSVKASTTQIKNALTQIANPEKASAFGATSVINKEKLTKMNESLVQAKREGNTLAASILSVTDRTPTVEIEKLQERIMDAKAKGEPIAGQIADIAVKNKTILPAANRIQTVSREDYNEVEKMWEENYRNLEVPSGMAGTRTEWIKDDVAKIDSIIAQLSSPDQEKVAAGMNEVSGILPFLLVGGFSITEIIAYLHAKQDAGKKTIAELAREEENKIEVKVKKTKTAAGHLTASASDSADTGDDLDDSSLANTSSAPLTQISDEILGMVNIKLPKISDLARFETLSLSKDKEKLAEIDNIQQTLKSINDPLGISNPADKEKYQKIKERLLDESKKGNPIASAVLSAASGVSTLSATFPDAKTVLSQIANPSLAGTESDKERFVALHEQLAKASQTGDQLASSLLSVKETASKEEIEKLSAKLREQKDSGHPLAASVLQNISSPLVLPATNRIQSVNEEDYRTVKELWKENYSNLEIPKEMAETRSEWIKNDISKIDTIINQLNSADPKEVNKAMEDVSAIVPFLLVGGFSSSEIISYMKAKQEAAEEVLAEFTREEEDKVSLRAVKKEEAGQQIATSVFHDARKVDEIGARSLSETTSQSGQTSLTPSQQSSIEILRLTNLEIPRLSDVVKYEVRHLTKDKKETERIEKIHEVLEKLGNPGGVSDAHERIQYQELQDKLAQESMKGNATADVILSAISRLDKTVGEINLTLADFKRLMVQISNSENITNQYDRDYYARLHDYLEKEYKEKNNTLAQRVLSINDSTKTSEIQEIQKQLSKEKETKLALPQLTGAIKDYSRVKQLRQFINQLRSAETIPSEKERENIIKLRDILKNESARGNSLAAALTTASEKTSDFELSQLYTKIVEAGGSGDQTAASVISRLSAPSGMTAQRLQEITPEEEQEVKSLWQKAYTQYFVPQGFTEDVKGRSEWINSDIAEIEGTIGLLNSSDETKREEGINKVSGIVPFLVLGGFSYEDMTKYLNIKLEAAKSALTVLAQEEDEKVSVETRVTSQNKKVISTAASQAKTSSDTQESSSAVQTAGAGAKIQENILNVINIKLPTMSDIARYESASLIKYKGKAGEVSVIHESLNKITNPGNITDPAEREKFQKLTERLREESSRNNIFSASILNAATNLSAQTFNNAPVAQIKNIFTKIVNPALSDSDAERNRLEELRNALFKDARANNNKLAQAILAVNEKTSVPQLEAIRDSLKKGQLEGARLASAVIWTINRVIFGQDRLKKSREVFAWIANPTLVTDAIARVKYSKAHDILLKTSLGGNQLSHSILSVTDKTTDHEVSEILLEVNAGKRRNDPVSVEVSELMAEHLTGISEGLAVQGSPIVLPDINQVQKVGREDYESVKKIWKETYKTFDLPEGAGANRREWIKDDILNIGSAIEKLKSNDPEEIEKGMTEVSNVLPFVLVGGFTKSEIISYLESKKEAAEETLSSETQEENDKMEVPSGNDPAENQEKSQAAEIEKEQNK